MLVGLALIVTMAIVGTSPTAVADEERRLIGQGVTSPGGLLVDPGGRVWVSDAEQGFCRLAEPANAVGQLELNTCLGGADAAPMSGPVRPGAAALIRPASGAEVVLIPDSAPGSSGVTRARWSASSGVFAYSGTLTMFGGDLRPTAVSAGPDGNAYVVFERTRSIVRIVNPAAEQPDLETIGFTAGLGARAIAAGVADPTGRVWLYIAEASSLTQYLAPLTGRSSGVAGASYAIGATSRLTFDSSRGLLFAALPGSGAGADVIARIDTLAGTFVRNWATGFTALGGLAPRASLVLAAEGTGDVYEVGVTDTVPPAPPVISSPASGSTVRPTFTLTVSAEAGATLQCSLDGAAAAACTSGQTMQAAVGTHTLSVTATDGAGNVSSPTRSDFTVEAAPPPPAGSPTHDFSGDGNPDVLARAGDGGLWLYLGSGTGGWGGARLVGSGWNGLNPLFTPGDFDGDGNMDVLARAGDGGLLLYAGNGAGGWGGARLVGSGWNGFTSLFGPGDFDGDGNMDVLARAGDGGLWLYPGNGAGGWGSARIVGSGWGGFTSLFGPGDWDGDGNLDVLARAGDGTLWLYPGSGTGGWGVPRIVGSGWGGMTALLGPGDWDGDGSPDVLARAGNGALWLYPGDGAGGWGVPRVVGSGWNGMTALI